MELKIPAGNAAMYIYIGLYDDEMRPAYEAPRTLIIPISL